MVQAVAKVSHHAVVLGVLKGRGEVGKKDNEVEGGVLQSQDDVEKLGGGSVGAALREVTVFGRSLERACVCMRPSAMGAVEALANESRRWRSR